MIHLTYDGSCPCSLDLRRERQRGVAMGTVGRGPLWFDADRTPASGIPAPEATRKSARHGFSKSGTGPPPRNP